MNRKSEAFALSGFMLNVNLVRLLVFKGVISAEEAMATVEESRHQLAALGTVNQAARADMLDRELLDYEALFEEVDEAAAQELMTTLAETLWRVMDDDARDGDLGTAPADAEVAIDISGWQRDGWGDDTATVAGNDYTGPSEDNADAAVMEVADYEDGDEEPANQP